MIILWRPQNTNANNIIDDVDEYRTYYFVESDASVSVVIDEDEEGFWNWNEPPQIVFLRQKKYQTFDFWVVPKPEDQ